MNHDGELRENKRKAWKFQELLNPCLSSAHAQTPVSGKICHSPIKKVKRQPTLIISFSQHSPFFEEQSKNTG